MAYDRELALRIRAVLVDRDDFTERRMFGGLAFLPNGRMLCGILGSDLMVRLGPDGHARALARPHVRPMDFTGRPMTGFVFVAPAGYRTRATLTRWIDEAAAFVSRLPKRARRRR